MKIKKEFKETDASSSGSFEGPLMDTPIIKKKITKIHNSEPPKIQANEDIGAGFDFDVPLFGKTPKGRKDPLTIKGPESIKSSKAVTDKKFPKWGGPGGVFIKVKEKCKKFPYCNQGDINAIEVLRESIENASKKYGLTTEQVEKIVLNEIKQIFI